jgi:hypothetical protein
VNGLIAQAQESRETYQKFKNSFAAISRENSNHGIRIDSKPSRTDGRQSVNQDGSPKNRTQSTLASGMAYLRLCVKIGGFELRP